MSTPGARNNPQTGTTYTLERMSTYVSVVIGIDRYVVSILRFPQTVKVISHLIISPKRENLLLLSIPSVQPLRFSVVSIYFILYCFPR